MGIKGTAAETAEELGLAVAKTSAGEIDNKLGLFDAKGTRAGIIAGTRTTNLVRRGKEGWEGRTRKGNESRLDVGNTGEDKREEWSLEDAG